MVLEAKNDIPFRATWVVTTKEGTVLSGLMMDPKELSPTPTTTKWSFRVSIPQNRMVDDHVELRVRFSSGYFAEQGLLYFAKAYRLVKGIPYPVTPESAARPLAAPLP